ncbi:MAG: DUF1553 domain-containing protein [Verrucomicrobiae bacterium]|nr:DUF1553 domain-containing protein [Verrucomicrobiae bacterium]
MRPLLQILAASLALACVGNGLGETRRAKPEDLWALRPIVRPEVPAAATRSSNPVDAFLAAKAGSRGLTPLEPADKATWLRRVCLDLTGLPPTIEQQQAFLADESPTARETVVDSLLASEQYGIRYGRHWLDVLRYADLDADMPAAAGIHLWRDWAIEALNRDLPFDEFARAQILGNRAAKRRTISPEGHIAVVGPRPEDLFALGFLARGATSQADTDQQLAISAVETISSAFLGMTVGCAKCHDHFYDPIREQDFYAMKALFDPLALLPVDLATSEQVFAHGRAVADHASRQQTLVDGMRRYIEPYHTRLYEERLSALPPDAQAAIRKPEDQRSAAEQKVADDYHPILRIDPGKIKEIMPADQIPRYDEFLKALRELKAPEPLPQFWTVAEDALRASRTNYVLKTGEPDRPILSRPVRPGFPFAQEEPEFREGRRETFVDWLTAPSNPLFARVAVNRLWQWHFGIGLHRVPNDFGSLGGAPDHPELLDFLAAEFMANGYRMKWLHRLLVTSDAYARASAGPRAVELANQALDPDNRLLWKFPLRRLEAEPIRDALLQVAGQLDTSLGGKSFPAGPPDKESRRRTAYMSRGYKVNQEAMPDYLQTFDAEDGRSVCPRRQQTITAPQALFMMNNPLAEFSAQHLSQQLSRLTEGDPAAAVRLGYQTALGRLPSEAERIRALDYLDGDPDRMKGFAWLLLNLDEFVFIR